MIRPIKQGDLDRLMEIWLEGNLDAHPDLPATYWQENRAAVRLALPQAKVLVYENRGHICGFIGVDDGYIAGMFVAGICRGKGVGSRLLRSAICKLGARRLDVYDQNQNALDFYLRHGFRVVDTHTDENTGALEHSMEFVE